MTNKQCRALFMRHMRHGSLGRQPTGTSHAVGSQSHRSLHLLCIETHCERQPSASNPQPVHVAFKGSCGSWNIRSDRESFLQIPRIIILIESARETISAILESWSLQHRRSLQTDITSGVGVILPGSWGDIGRCTRRCHSRKRRSFF